MYKNLSTQDLIELSYELEHKIRKSREFGCYGVVAMLTHNLQNIVTELNEREKTTQL